MYIKALGIILIGIFTHSTAPKDCIKCNIEKVKIVNDNINHLSYVMVADFLCTFDNSCNDNTEYSEWSNEILYKILENNPSVFFSVIEKDKSINNTLLLKETENPAMDNINFQKIYNQITTAKASQEYKDKYSKAIEAAAKKNGQKIKK